MDEPFEKPAGMTNIEFVRQSQGQSQDPSVGMARTYEWEGKQRHMGFGTVGTPSGPWPVSHSGGGCSEQ